MDTIYRFKKGEETSKAPVVSSAEGGDPMGKEGLKGHQRNSAPTEKRDTEEFKVKKRPKKGGPG